MRIFLILSVVVIAIKHARCKIDLKRDKEVIIDIDSPELHQSQYHTADFDTSAYNYGYAVEPNGQFHHETRGGDGVTYGCYGYIDSDDLLKVTHYVADSQGYRTLEHEKPVLVYPIDENAVDTYEKQYKPKGVMLDWKDLYFPIGCGMAKGGVVLNAPVILAPDGHFEQLGETKFPVQPSSEPKVVVPHIPLNVGIKTSPTKLIPLNGNNVGSIDNIHFQPKVTTPRPFPSTQYVSPSVQTSQRTKSRPNISSINVEYGSEYSIKNSKQPNDHTLQPTLIPTTSTPNSIAETVAPFRDPVTVTVPVPTDSIQLNNVRSPLIPINSLPVQESHSTNEEGLLPPFSTTHLSDRRTTASVPYNSISPDDDFNIINSYTQINPASSTAVPVPTGYKSEEKIRRGPIRNNDFSNNDNGYSAFPSFTPTISTPTEKVYQFSTTRPNKFEGFKFNSQTTDPTTDSYSESSTVLTTQQTDPLTTVFDEIVPYTRHQLPDTTYQTSNKFSTSKHEPSVDLFVTTESSQLPYIESSTTSKTIPNFLHEFETSTSQTTYPGIGDYNKPQRGFEFNIPTRAPISASTREDFEDSSVTINNKETTENDLTNPEDLGGVYAVDRKEPSYDDLEKTGKFTNGPHGPEYQLGSRIPHSQVFLNHVRDGNYNYRHPVKQSRKETNAQDVSLITPLTHLTISGTYPLKDDGTVTSITEQSSTEPAQLFSDNPTNRQPSTSPTFTNSFHGFDTPHVVIPVRQKPIQPEHEPNRPQTQQPTSFFAFNTPKNEPSPGIITHMDAISQTRYQSNRVTPSLTSVTSNDQQNRNELIFNPQSNYYKTPGVTQPRQPETSKSTESPFLYTRPHTFSFRENSPYRIESPSTTYSSDSNVKLLNEDSSIYSGSFGEKIKPGTTSFTAYERGSTSKPSIIDDIITPSYVQDRSYKQSANIETSPPYQPKFVMKQSVAPPSNVNTQSILNSNGYSDNENRNANFYPNYIQQKSIEVNKNQNNKIQPERKFVNTKIEFVPQYNPNSIPGSLGTAIGVYPPNLDELTPDIPNFSIAISKWPFYIVPFPFGNGNINSFPFINGMPFPLGNGNIVSLPNNNNINGVNGGGGSGEQPAQTICSWLSSFITPQENATNTEIPTSTDTNGETLQISNLQVKIKNPQLQINQNAIPYGIVGFIPIIAVPNCQHNANGDNSEPSAFPTNIQLPNLCSQLTHLIGSQINEKKTNQPTPI